MLGPGIDPHATSESFEIMKQFGDGTLEAGVPRWGVGVVNVRELGLTYSPLDETVVALFQQLVDSGAFETSGGAPA